MFERFQKAIAPSVIVPTLAVTSVRAPGNTTIESLVIWGIIDSDSVIFNVRVNGVQQFVGGARPTFVFGVSDHDEVTGLSIDVLLGDIISLDVEELPSGGVRNIVFQTNFASGDLLPTGGTTGQVLTKESNTDFNVGWEDLSTGGGAGAGLLVGPRTVNVENDEFDAAALDAKWTRTGTIPGVVSYDDIIRSAVYVRCTGGTAQDLSLTQPFVPGSSDFSVSACGWMDLRENFNNFVLGVCDSGGPASNSLQANFIFGSSRKITFQKYVSGSGTFDIVAVSFAGTGALMPEGIILHIQRVSGVWGIWYSFNGLEWQSLSTTHSQSITVANINVNVGSGGGTVNKISGAIHWVRRDWLFL